MLKCLRLATAALLLGHWLLGYSLAVAASPQVQGAGGGVNAQSPTRRVSGTLGQSAAGRAQSTQRQVSAGFWHTLQGCACPFVGDLDTNSVINIFDVVGIINVAFRGGEFPPSDPFCPAVNRADVTCDGAVTILDVSTIINAAFRGNDQRCDPCAG